MGVHERAGISRGYPGKIQRSRGMWCLGVLEEVLERGWEEDMGSRMIGK